MNRLLKRVLCSGPIRRHVRGNTVYVSAADLSKASVDSMEYAYLLPQWPMESIVDGLAETTELLVVREDREVWLHQNLARYVARTAKNNEDRWGIVEWLVLLPFALLFAAVWLAFTIMTWQAFCSVAGWD